VDFNLLVGLDALLEQRSVQDAAAQLHLTPPAVSRILSRLRKATGDELLVRSGREMIPTARALEIQSEVRDLVARAEQLLSPGRPLDLTQLQRSFVVRCHESLAPALAPGMVQAIRSEAPQVQLRILGEGSGDDRDLAQGLVDLDVGADPPASTGLRTHLIASDRMMLVAPRNSALDVTEPAIDDIVSIPHVAISRRGRDLGPLDERLAQAGLRRRVIATVPTTAAALAIMKITPSATVVPERLTRSLPDGLVARPLPFALQTAPIAMSWHRRQDSDPAHTWLRNLVSATLRSEPDT
jgi:DNA-binding transcriptional LysR family regulator